MSPSSLLLQSFFLVATTVATATTTAAVVPPSTGKDWISLNKGVEFQPAAAAGDASDHQKRALRKAQRRFLEEQANEYSSSGKQLSYVDSKETYYDGYAQAWRYVGFYTDCNPVEDDHRRRLNKKNNRQLQENEEDACIRYLLWAAYVDLDYSGGGIGEYQFFDTYKEEWDTSACEATGHVNEDGTVDEKVCRKCDCHMPDTKWQLLGYFKEVEYTEWFEQLFKHEGYCVWQENEYDFMYENYNAWPEGCSETEIYLSDGTLLYTDTKAEANGTMTYGLYTDARCSTDYTGDEVTVQSLLSNGDNDRALSWANLEYWNKAMEIYRVCQPCRAYALNQNYGGEDRQRQRKQRKLEDNDPNGGLFQCDDAAGYSNVNQCMKFRSKTDMEYATLDEVMEAALQGGITSLTIGGRTYGAYKEGIDIEAERPDWNLLWIAISVLAVGLSIAVGGIVWSHTRCRGTSRSLKEPLIPSL